MYSDIPVIKWITTAIIVILILIAGHALLDYLLLARLSVTTSDPSSTILVYKGIQPNQINNTAPVSNAQGKLIAQIGAGDYTITVGNKHSSSQRFISLKHRESLKLNFKLLAPSAVEAVSSLPTHDVLATSNSITYADSSSGAMYTIDGSGNQKLLDNSRFYSSIKWVSSDVGVAQDTTNQLYVVRNGAITPLSLPFSPSNTGLSYAVSPNGSIYLAANSRLYKGSLAGDFTKIYGLHNQTAGLVASDSGVAVFDINGSSSSQQAREANSIITFIPDSGGAKIIHAESYQGAWSPNGKYLATTSEAGTYIYDSSLKQITVLPKPEVTSLVWLSDNTLLYGVSGGLWSYTLSSSSANLLGSVSGGYSIVEINPARDSSYVYLLTETQQGSSPTYILSRLGLYGQAVSEVAGELQVFLPNTLNECSVNFVNFDKLSILTTGPNGTQNDCIQQAQTYLQQYNIDTSKLQFTFTQSL